jgi:sialidase-1
MNSALFRPFAGTRTINLRGRRPGLRAPKNSLPRLFVGADGVVGAPLLAPCDGGLFAGAAGSNLGASGYRIPAMIRAANGDILLFVEGRSDNTLDYKANLIAVTRSRDNGKTFDSPAKVVAETAAITTYFIGNPAVGLWTPTGRLHLVYHRHKQSTPAAADLSLWHTTSDDHGATWAAPVDVTAALRVGGGGTTPTGHPFPATDWFDCFPGPCTAAYHPGTGRLVFAGYYRLTDGGVPYPYNYYTADNGTTWVIKGPTQGAANQNAIEGAIALCPDGSTLLVNCRMKSGTQRSQYSSTDGGTTWGNIAAVSGPGNQTNQGCQGAMITVGSKMLLSVSDSTTDHRTLPSVYQSDDGGATWGNARRLGFRHAAYSALVQLGATDYLAVFEGFPTGTLDSAVSSSQALYPHYFNASFLSAPQVPEFDWAFDDLAATSPVVAGESTLANGGTNLRDRGQNTRINYSERVQARDASNQPAVGTTGVGSRLAMTLDSDSDYISLAPPGCYAMQPGSGQAFTLQIVLSCTGTSATIARSASSGARWMLDLNANGRPVATLSDGTNTVTTADTGATINDGAFHCIVLRRTGTRVQVLVDGVQTQDLADTTGSLRQDTEVRVGCDHSGTTQLAGVIDRIHWTLGSVADSQLITAADKGSPDPGISIAAGSPLTFTNLKLWLPTSYPRLWHAGWYLEGPRTVGNRTAIGAQSVRDAANGKLWQIATNSVLQAARPSGHLVYDSNLGWMRNIQSDPAPTGLLGVPLARAANTDLDFIQLGGTGGAFTVGCGVVVTGSTSTTQALFDNINGTGANNGFGLILTDANPAPVQFMIARGGASVYNQTSAATIAYNQPFMILITSAGNGAGVDFYMRRIDTNTTPGSATTLGTSPTSGAGASTLGLGVGGRVGAWTGPGTGGADKVLLGRIAEPFVTNSNLSAAEIQTYFDWLKNGPTRR